MQAWEHENYHPVAKKVLVGSKTKGGLENKAEQEQKGL